MVWLSARVSARLGATGRDTMGVALMELREPDTVVAVARSAELEPDGEADGGAVTEAPTVKDNGEATSQEPVPGEGGST